MKKNINSFYEEDYIDSDNEILARLYEEKDIVSEEIKHEEEVRNPFIDKRADLVGDLNNINREICNIRGHRLYGDSRRLTRIYGYVYTCAECGYFIPEAILSNKDVILGKGKHKYTRILYKR